MKAHLQVIFTLDELAAYLKVGKRTLYRLAAHGEIPAFKVGGTWRFPQSEIDQWINDQTRAGAKKEVMRKREQIFLDIARTCNGIDISASVRCAVLLVNHIKTSFHYFFDLTRVM